jgi:transposase InsO family protein
VLRLRSDQGGEFSSNALSEFCDTLGIVQKFTNAYSPQENGIVERANGIVLPRLRAMRTVTHLPNSLWGEALLHVVTTLNWLPTKPLGLVSPHQKFFKCKPRLEDLRTWGCVAHVRVPPESRQRKD